MSLRNIDTALIHSLLRAGVHCARSCRSPQGAGRGPRSLTLAAVIGFLGLMLQPLLVPIAFVLWAGLEAVWHHPIGPDA